jgi:aryl-alcohol dehydrogenase-like predicted oxidoreductase
MSTATTLSDGDFRRLLPRFTPQAMAANQTLVDLLRRMANDKRATPAQVALGWSLAQRRWIVPIPGTTRLARLADALAQIAVEGERYPAQLLASTGL